jgi:DNA repair photolyase
MLRPGVPAPSLASRLGNEVVRERAGVQYRELRTRSLIGRCDSARMPFEWTVNPYRGCAFGCRYCYAAYTHEFLGVAVPEAFHSSVYVKTGGETETARRLVTVRRRGEAIQIGAATDPYQPGESDFKVTRRFLELVAQQRGLRLSITTKGALILRDLELLQRIRQRSSLQVHVSLISPHAELLRAIEPLAPPPEVRLHVMRRLVDAGIDASLTVAPVLPALTDREPDLELLFERARAAGVQSASHALLFLRSPTREKYFRWLAAEFPRYLEAYQSAYASRVYLRGGYRRRIQALFERLHERHGMRKGWSDETRPERPRAPEQLSLWARGGTS